MKTWKWTRTALSVLTLGVLSISVGCEDSSKVTPSSPPLTPPPGSSLKPPEGTPAATAKPEKPEAGSDLSGGVEVPAAETPAAEKPAEAAPAEGEKPAEEKPAEEKPAEEKPAEEKPAEEKPAEEKKPE